MRPSFPSGRGERKLWGSEMPHEDSMRRFILIAAFFALTGCATSTKAQGPDGRVAHVIKCEGGIEYCWQKAGELCPSGYDVLGSNSSAVGVPMSTGGTIVTSQQSLVVSCK